MPYSLRKSPKKDAYWVVNTQTGKKHSINPLPYSRARAQMAALYAVENGYILDRSKRRSRKYSKPRKTKSRRVRGGEDQQTETVVFEGGKSKSKTPKRWVSKITAKLEHPGSLSNKAKRAGKDTHTFACDVLRSPSKYSEQTRKQAQFFVNINKHNKC
jgi:hypothetical protein